MTGSAFQAMDVVWLVSEIRNGRGSGGGGAPDRSGSKAGGFILEVQNRAPMQVKLTFSEKYRFLGFHERRFTCMGAHFRPESSSHAGKTAIFNFKKQGFHCLSFSRFLLFLVPFWRPLGFFWKPFGASVVSLACWCYP